MGIGPSGEAAAGGGWGAVGEPSGVAAAGGGDCAAGVAGGLGGWAGCPAGCLLRWAVLALSPGLTVLRGERQEYSSLDRTALSFCERTVQQTVTVTAGNCSCSTLHWHQMSSNLPRGMQLLGKCHLHARVFGIAEGCKVA